MKKLKYDDNVVDINVETLKNGIDWWERTPARFEYFMSNKTIEYTYGSGINARTYKSMPFDDIVKSIMDNLNEIYNTDYDICFLNRYDNEKMALGWHADDSPEIDLDHPIAVISIGAEREIWVKEKSYKGLIPNEDRYLLKNGSLFIMPSGFQKTHLHKIPKWDRPCNTRISLTFRKYSGV